MIHVKSSLSEDDDEEEEEEEAEAEAEAVDDAAQLVEAIEEAIVVGLSLRLMG
jgi:hypothetical protein